MEEDAGRRRGWECRREEMEGYLADVHASPNGVWRHGPAAANRGAHSCHQVTKRAHFGAPQTNVALPAAGFFSAGQV